MTPPPLILSVETATMGGGVSVLRGRLLISTLVGASETSHSNSLLRDISACLATAGVVLRDIDVFAAASGPGSFTGLRIGLATVKALAATLSRPCIGVPTLHAIAIAAGLSEATVALLPAGRGEVFVQQFSVAADKFGEQVGQVRELDLPNHLSPQKMLDKYRSLANIKWAGPGAHLHRHTIERYAREYGIQFTDTAASAGPQQAGGWNLVVGESNLSKSIAALALQQLELGNVGNPLSLRALYVRPSDAELKCQ